MNCPNPDCGAYVRVEAVGQYGQRLVRAHPLRDGRLCQASEAPMPKVDV